jgi:hypothetical protein
MAESKIDLAYIIKAINSGTLKEHQVMIAKEILENEIMQSEDVLQDDETEVLSRREFQAKLSLYRKLKNRL